MEKLTKLSFGFTAEDMKLITRLRKRTEAVQGKTSVVSIIRAALRAMESK